MIIVRFFFTKNTMRKVRLLFMVLLSYMFCYAKAEISIWDSNSYTMSNNQCFIHSVNLYTIVEGEAEEEKNERNLIDGHEYVDLGLPSGKYWSTVNYGANSPEDVGKYSDESLISGWGEYWTTPTLEEFQELIDECEWTWTNIGGINGFSIKGENGNLMFLPAAGYYDLIQHNQNEVNRLIGGGGSITSEYRYSNERAYYWTKGGTYNVGDKSGIQMRLYLRSVTDYMPIRPISTVKNESVFTKDGLNYSIVSSEERTVNIAKGKYGKVLEVPQSITYPDKEWSVVGIDDEVLLENEELSAIIWNPEVAFTEVVTNPNLLLYVKNASYAPAEINNVIVDGFADNITLTDADSRNNFYCPQEFKAKKISYTHHYKMETGFGESKGWETIALPFNVQKITHQDRGEIVPFTIWNNEENKKPFWLMEFGNSGWKNASYIKAYTPYIISMPNHEKYKADYKLNGNVTFSAEMAKVGVTENLLASSYNGKTFVPNFSLQTDNSYYALNVNNDYIVYNGNKPRGSMFFIGLRDIHPFEAYMTTTSGARSIAIADDMTTTGIRDIMEMLDEQRDVRVYNLKGQLIKKEGCKALDQVKKMLPAGVYIVNGQKLIIK